MSEKRQVSEQLSRRDFLKIGTGAGVATGLGAAARRVVLEPFVRPPEQELPGRATWYASTCRQCPAGCGIIVRVINGRPRKIEGNPAHPLNRGKLCARGQAGLQLLYNPDRLKGAVRQTGGRGSRQFEPVEWTVAIDELRQTLAQMPDPSRLAFLGGLIPDSLHVLLSEFLNSFGAPPPVLFDLHTALDARSASAELSQRWFGSRRLPIYDISRAQAVFSFGANFLETWMSPVSQSHAFGTMRGGQLGGRGFVVQFEPRLSSTGASADEWIPLEPGTEGLVALGIGRIIVEEDLGRVGSHREHADLYRDVNVGQIAELSGVSAEELLRLARLFADVDRSVAIPGGYLGGLSNGAEAMDAVMALNVVMRRLGREGGLFLPQEVPAETFAQPVSASAFSELEQLVDRMRGGEIEVLFLHSANPIYELPDWVGFRKAVQQVPLVVCFNQFIDETAVQADLILPDHTYLEGWGYQIVTPGADRPVVSSQQPVSNPRHQTRSTTDVFLTLAQGLGDELASALPWADEVAFLEQYAAELLGSSIGVFDSATPAGFWSRWRQLGGWWSENPIRQEPVITHDLSIPLGVPAAEFQGDQQAYPFHLLPFESISLSDGRGANQPWLQEIPDPMTTARWNSWVELGVESAERLGIEDNDLVRVSSPEAELTAPAVVHPGLRPDVIAIPTGQGHRDYGRFAVGRGANVMELVAPADSSLLWASTRVRVEAVGEHLELARLESLEGEGRETIR
jgi:anaerobic selenocysteine-containing dehydrogenase